MPCYYPLDAYRAAKPNESGRYPLVFSPHGAQIDEPLKIACGQCHGCRLERSRQWAVRCVHEAQCYDDNSFLTLTYAPENRPKDGSLEKMDFQKFIKRLRKKFSNKTIRYYMCGEYGEDLQHPHFHAIIFNHDFADKEPCKTSGDDILYRSQTLDNLWPYGHAWIGSVTFESAAYVARYVMKKVNGDLSEDHYQKVNLESGEVTHLQPEYTACSLKPGIGEPWFMRFKSDLRKGFITLRGVKMPVPKYYETLMERHDEKLHLDYKELMRTVIDYDDPENTLERLRVRETIRLKKTQILLPRNNFNES